MADNLVTPVIRRHPNKRKRRRKQKTFNFSISSEIINGINIRIIPDIYRNKFDSYSPLNVNNRILLRLVKQYINDIIIGESNCKISMLCEILNFKINCNMCINSCAKIPINSAVQECNVWKNKEPNLSNVNRLSTFLMENRVISSFDENTSSRSYELDMSKYTSIPDDIQEINCIDRSDYECKYGKDKVIIFVDSDIVTKPFFDKILENKSLPPPYAISSYRHHNVRHYYGIDDVNYLNIIKTHYEKSKSSYQPSQKLVDNKFDSLMFFEENMDNHSVFKISYDLLPGIMIKNNIDTYKVNPDRCRLYAYNIDYIDTNNMMFLINFKKTRRHVKTINLMNFITYLETLLNISSEPYSAELFISNLYLTNLINNDSNINRGDIMKTIIKYSVINISPKSFKNFESDIPKPNIIKNSTKYGKSEVNYYGKISIGYDFIKNIWTSIFKHAFRNKKLNKIYAMITRQSTEETKEENDLLIDGSEENIRHARILKNMIYQLREINKNYIQIYSNLIIQFMCNKHQCMKDSYCLDKIIYCSTCSNKILFCNNSYIKLVCQKSGTHLICDDCSNHICIQCGCDHHETSETCDLDTILRSHFSQDDEITDEDFLELKSYNTACPKCCVVIGKTDGCDKMICPNISCNICFCFVCRTILNKRTPYANHLMASADGMTYVCPNRQINNMHQRTNIEGAEETKVAEPVDEKAEEIVEEAEEVAEEAEEVAEEAEEIAEPIANPIGIPDAELVIAPIEDDIEPINNDELQAIMNAIREHNENINEHDLMNIQRVLFR